jgi:predicted RND superfamily exporter protein
VDNIEQGGTGEVKFEWLMSTPPETDAEALAIRDKALNLHFLRDTLVSENGKALAIYLPVSSKDLSYKVYSRLQKKIDELEGDDAYYITGLPVANDVFGVEMFIQMAISAPLAMLAIFLLMLIFFRKLILIVSPLLLALLSVIFTMGLLILTGNTIHIMSSMIPIFIMPIAVLDSVHILSEFFDRYQETKNKKTTILHVIQSLFKPMIFTSLTSAAGFASLALTPIPPVQVFGIFVALGVLFAWFLTMTFIPAFIMLIPDRLLANFGASHHGDRAQTGKGLMGGFLGVMDSITYNRAKIVVALGLVAVVVAGYGIGKIRVNDNPTKWFKQSHPIRVADRVLNKHFGGTYMAYLALRPKGEAIQVPETAQSLPVALEDTPALPMGLNLGDDAPDLPAGLGGEPALPMGLPGATVTQDEVVADARAVEMGEEIFKHPEVLRYMAALQEHLLASGVVGKSNSLADVVKTVHRELIDGTEAQYRIPDSVPGVAQCLMQYQSSHRPGDLWHFVTPDYRQSSLWVQLKSGDNMDMERVVSVVDEYVTANPLPFELEHNWFGLTYINVVWQEKMVSGMAQAFMGSFVVVLLMMSVLFRSVLWGLLSMIPLTITIGLIYGIIGLVGKDYDMPVAVLSSLTLGLAVDFAIHFLARSRELEKEHGSWSLAHRHVFGEPARAITRNVIVIAIGFTPLLAAPLLPYKTVGVFLASILLISGAGTLLLLPALVRLLERWLFSKKKGNLS